MRAPSNNAKQSNKRSRFHPASTSFGSSRPTRIPRPASARYHPNRPPRRKARLEHSDEDSSLAEVKAPAATEAAEGHLENNAEVQAEAQPEDADLIGSHSEVDEGDNHDDYVHWSLWKYTDIFEWSTVVEDALPPRDMDESPQEILKTRAPLNQVRLILVEMNVDFSP